MQGKVGVCGVGEFQVINNKSLSSVTSVDRKIRTGRTVIG
jgi:hypothetical protein